MFHIVPPGLLIALASVLAGSLGVPLPTLPLLIFAGSMLPVLPHGVEVGGVIIIVGIACALIGDLAWFAVGRHYGVNILRLMCRLSLSRDTCVRNTADLFARRGLGLLLFSRFLPGLAMVTSPLAGASGIGLRRFVLYDAVGAAVWIGAGLAVGFVFADQIADLMLALQRFGLDLGGAVVALVVVYLAGRWLHRRLLIRHLRMARMSVAELCASIAAGEAPVIIDVRSAPQLAADPFLIPGALFARQAELGSVLARVAADQPIIVYCSCPNEASAALMVKEMHKRGISNIHPLSGGIDAWRAAGYRVDPLVAEAVAA